MNNIQVHPATSKMIDNFVTHPSHAVMLVGKSGSGKLLQAQNLSAELLQIPSSSVMASPYIKLITVGDKLSIGIDSIRAIDAFLRLTVPGHSKINRIIIIDQAHYLTVEAQNALLKNLEQPPAKTAFILLVSDQNRLLPTIVSRVQKIRLHVPNKAATTSHFDDKGYDQQQIAKAYVVSGGMPRIISELLDNDESELFEAAAVAKQLLQGAAYDRLLLVDTVLKDKQKAKDVIAMLQNIAFMSLKTANTKHIQRWTKVLAAAQETADDLEKNALPKLALTKLMLNI